MFDLIDRLVSFSCLALAIAITVYIPVEVIMIVKSGKGSIPIVDFYFLGITWAIFIWHIRKNL